MPGVDLMETENTTIGLLPIYRACGYIPFGDVSGLTFVANAAGGICFERTTAPNHLVANDARRSWANAHRKATGATPTLPVLLITDKAEALGVMTEMLTGHGYQVAGADSLSVGLSMLLRSGMAFQSVVLCLEGRGTSREIAEVLLPHVISAAPGAVLLTRPNAGNLSVARHYLPSGSVITLPATESEILAAIVAAPKRAARRLAY